jgi:maltose phosphorylase
VEAAKNLLEFRYLTLPEAKARAKALDCQGAFYPIATISGRECCSLWQHASLQLQASTAVAYGIRHYETVTKDEAFVFTTGLPILIEISRMLATRGAWNADHTNYGYYGVMGPDEFQMMVNNNCYTNFMGMITLEYTLDVIKRLKNSNQAAYDELAKKHGLSTNECVEWACLVEHMFIPYNEKTMLFEEHEGYFNLPHLDVNLIPIEDFPLYHHWSYDRIYRNDMIKQPDVLMMMLLYNGSFTEEQLKKNYEFYEPRCIHESSLSPSVHSILAAQLKKYEEAYKFFGFATRMDLDNYNRNTAEGLHTTSIAAAWMNIVYGFGGMRSDKEMLSFAPSIPEDWNGYSFRIRYQKDVIEIDIKKDQASFHTGNGSEISVNIYGKKYTLTGEQTIVSIQ